MGTKNHRYNAFTLIELIIVLTIIALLAMLAIAAYSGQAVKGNDARRKSDVNRIEIAVEEYEKDHNCYPSQDSMKLCGTDPSIAINPYLSNVPCDPTTKTAYYYEADGTTNCSGWYRISAELQNTNDSQATAQCGPGGAYNFLQASPDAPDCQYSTKLGAWGCKNGICVPLLWNNIKSQWECTPYYHENSCDHNACGDPEHPADPCL